MNIGCDARALVGPLTGVGVWTSQVMAGLAAETDCSVHLAASRTIDLPPELCTERVFCMPPPALPIPGTLWLHSALPARLGEAGVDVFVASLGIVPRRCPVPAVVMLHDITPRTHPKRHTLANRFCFNAYLEESLDRARAVVVGSQATEEVAVQAFPWISHRLHRISYGVDRFFSPAPVDDDGSRVGDEITGGRPFILHLGTLEPRKGLLTLVEAWERLHDELEAPPSLVLAGTPGWGISELLARLEASPHRAHIHQPGYVSRSQARELLQHTACFVLASEAEGFGLPLAEAISCGAPCVASAIPSLREAGGEACLYAPQGDSEAFALQIRAALQPEVGRGLRAKAAERAPQLRWEPVVHAWRQLLEDVVNG